MKGLDYFNLMRYWVELSFIIKTKRILKTHMRARARTQRKHIVSTSLAYIHTLHRRQNPHTKHTIWLMIRWILSQMPWKRALFQNLHPFEIVWVYSSIYGFHQEQTKHYSGYCCCHRFSVSVAILKFEKHLFNFSDIPVSHVKFDSSVLFSITHKTLKCANLCSRIFIPCASSKWKHWKTSSVTAWWFPNK